MASRLTAVLIVIAAVCAARPAAAADLRPETSDAYAAYAGQARRAFLARTRTAPAPPRAGDGVLSASPGREDGIISVAGGLVHHWLGAAFVRGARLRDVIAVSTSYADYNTMYKAVIESRLLAREEDTYRVLMRLKEGEAGITAVLDVRSTIEYVCPAERTAVALSTADEIREVKDAGSRDEHLLPPGRDSGYLWRAGTFTYFVEHAGGVYLEMETLGLSRRFPPLLGWIIEPIARRLGRRSVETSLQEFVAAIHAARGRTTGPALPCVRS